MKLTSAITLVALAPCRGLWAQAPRPDPLTIVAREVQGWFYADGNMKPSAPQFELVFTIRDSSVVRLIVRDINTGQTTTDNTEYQFVTDLLTFDPHALAFRPLTDDARRLGPVVRAIGRPGADAVEVLFIGPDWIQSVKTVKDYVVISRYRRTQ